MSDVIEILPETTSSHIVVGTAATMVVGSDRYPATIVDVQLNGRRIVIQEDGHRGTDKHEGPFGNQDYEYFTNPNGQKIVYTLRKNGEYKRMGSNHGNIFIGSRRYYYDPSF